MTPTDMAATAAMVTHVYTVAASHSLRVRNWSFPGSSAFAVYTAGDTYIGVVQQLPGGTFAPKDHSTVAKANRATLVALCKALGTCAVP